MEFLVSRKGLIAVELDIEDDRVGDAIDCEVAFCHQAQEAFLEGHVLDFERLGAVPALICYDNLKAAMGWVMDGGRWSWAVWLVDGSSLAELSGELTS